MHPVDFGGHFGWLYEPGSQSSENGKSGIVICGPLGHEALWLHQTMRSLADRLAEQGFAVLRFDYAGTGDSVETGKLVEPDKWASEAVEAVNFLRESTGVERVSMIGIRFGAMVAVQAAQAARVDTLALIAPVVVGRQFVREMSILQRAWFEKTSRHITGHGAPDYAFDVIGHRFCRQSIDVVNRCDLRRVTAAPANQFLIVHALNQGPSYELGNLYTTLGARVDSLPFPEYPEAMQPSWQAVLPEATLQSIEKWFVREVAHQPSVSPRAASFGTAVPSRRGVGLDGVVETPVELAGGRLFAMLCEPENHPGRSPMVVIANTAATHHVGDGRFNVDLARSLARAGIASMRVDAHGIGDSRGAGTVANPSLLSYDQLAEDTSLAIDWAVERGHPHVAVFGICSGAYLGLRAATKNPAVAAALLVNLQSFDFPEGFRMCDAATIGAGSTSAHFRAMFRVRKWTQVLRGEVSLRPVLRTLTRYAVDTVASKTSALVGSARSNTTNKGARARRRMKDLDARGVRVRLLFSPLDHGLDELRMHFGPGGKRLNKLSHASAMIIPNMDHEVLNPAARQSVADLCESFFRQAFTGK